MNTEEGREAKSGFDEFGDFQTPHVLAARICRFLADQGLTPASVLEPTCGKGSLLLSALDHFPSVVRAIGIDTNEDYVNYTAKALTDHSYDDRVQVFRADFFAVHWATILGELPEPVLILGNPPWVTNSALESVGSTNLPRKSNFKELNGLSALTGKANFDISEWMLIRLLEDTAARKVTLAMLCKSAVARRTLAHAWRTGIRLGRAAIYGIDAKRNFGASVDACLLVCHTTDTESTATCEVYTDIDPKTYQRSFGFGNGRLIANIAGYQKWTHLQSLNENRLSYRWRSGLKHDCSKVMELRREGDHFVNGLGEAVLLEYDYVYPMLKSSEVSNGGYLAPERWMVVPQKRVGADTSEIAEKAPRTWRYLYDHREMLDSRRSSLYRGKPRFSVFGVGEYTFAPWKVAISGLYKRLRFTVVEPIEGKPVVLDDTCNFVPCQTEEEAVLIMQLLESAVAKEFYESLIFWDAKRPITIEILNQLDIVALARELHLEAKLKHCLRLEQPGADRRANQQMRLL